MTITRLLTRAAVMLLLALLSTTSWAELVQDADGYYLIGTNAEWTEFANGISGGAIAVNAKAKLTADITASTMIGTGNKKYAGTFDGNDHVITSAINTTGSYVAPFSYIDGATIQNLTIAGTVNGGIHCSGLIGCSNGTNTVSNVTINASITTSDSHCGGFIGHGFSSNVTFTNCVFAGEIHGRSANSLVGVFNGWSGNNISLNNCLEKGTYTNCNPFYPLGYISTATNTYYLTPPSSGETKGTRAYSTMPEGEVCGQILAVDGNNYYVSTVISGINDRYELLGASVTPEPVVTFLGNTLIKDTDYTLSYNNNTSGGTGSVTITGIGSYSGAKTIEFQIAATTLSGSGTEESPFIIDSDSDWTSFANSVNSGYTYTGLFVKMTNSVNAASMAGQREGEPFSGTFDGDGYTLTLVIVNTGTSTDINNPATGTAPFHYIKNATIKNVKTAGTVTATSIHASGLVGMADGTNTIQGCTVSATINTTSSYVGGILAHGITSNTTIRDCVFDGAINGRSGGSSYLCGIYGWCHGGSPVITNCIEKGTYTNVGSYFNPVFLSWAGSANVSNTYYYQPNNNGSNYGTQVYATIPDGEMCGKITAVDGLQHYVVTTVSGINERYVLTGASVEPVPTVKFFNTTLVNGTDYTVTYNNNTSGGTGSVIITGTETAYWGVKTVNFIIAANTLPGEGTVESPYTISDTDDWVEFVNSVHNGFSYSGKIVQLTANINITSSVGLREDFPFSGTFDGAGHTLTANISANGANTSGNVEGVAPFHFIKNATIKNLKIAGTITSTSNHTAGLVGFASGTNTIQSCVVSATLNVSANYVGGFIGHGQFSSITITDCLFDGNIARQTNSSNPAASFWGWSGSYANISNCLENGTYTNCSSFDAYGWLPSNRVLNNVYRKNNSSVGTLVTEEDLSNGTTTAALQNGREETVWVQDPVTNRPMLKTFISLTHLTQDADGYYLLGSVQDWDSFATLVQTTPTANAKMTADIDLGDDQTMVGTENNKYQGTFDGQGHKLTIAYNVTEDNAAPFRFVSGANIRNLHVDGTINTTQQFAGGVVARAVTSVTSISNCWSSVNIIGTYNEGSGGDTDFHGGLVAIAINTSTTIDLVHLNDCLFTGSIKGGDATRSHCANFIGLQEYANSTITNCLSTATYTDQKQYNASYHWYYGGGTVSNALFLHANYTSGNGGRGTQISTEQLANGTATATLNAGRTGDNALWVQDHVTKQPMLKTFISLTHLTQDADGYYLLGSIQDWDSFATLVQITPTANAKMTADIDLRDDQTMVGTYAVKYQGTFDGQGHTLTINYNTSSMTIESGQSYLGAAPFRDIQNATIRNLHTAGTVTADKIGATGLVGWAYGENTIERCWSSVDIVSSNNTADTFSGFVFRQDGSLLTMNDCYYSGMIQSERKWSHAGFVGHHNAGTAVLNNCLVIFADGTDVPASTQPGNKCYTFVRDQDQGKIITLNNCYYKTAFGTPQGTQATTEQLSDGTITTALQNGREEEVWVQDPVTNQPMLALFANTISFNGDGSEDNPFIITTTAELDYLASMVNSGEYYHGMYFKLGADIAYDPNVLTIDNNGDGVNDSNYIPIGTGVFYYYNTPVLPSFRGIFDGDGHTISGIRIYREGNTWYDCYQGVFGFIQDFSGPGDSFYAGIYNLWVADVDITGWYNIGGIVGGNYNCIIENCHVASNVVIRANNQDDVCRLGGIVGYNETKGTVTRCSSAVTIIPSNNNSYYDFGGLAGYDEGILTNNLVIGATIPAVNHPDHNNFYGAIAGSRKLNYSSLQHNYYSACTVGGVPNATNVGCGPLISENNGVCSDLYDNNGAVPGNVRTVAAPNVWISEDPENESIDGWAFIASPLTDDTDPESTSVENIFSATDYDLYRLNPSNTKWENWKVGDGNNAASGFSLENGRGYLYATQETDTIKFNGEADEFNLSDTTEVALSQGFNLVGNPFPRAAYINKPYYTLNADGSAVSTSTSTAYIPPCYGVVVDANEGETVTFTTTAPAQQNAVNNGNLQIAVSQVPELVEGPARDKGGVSTGSTTATLDNAIVSFNEGERLGKFYFGSQNANIYLPQNGKDYAIAYSKKQGEMPLNFKASKSGEYCLSVNPEGVEMSYLHLIDNMTGADIDLLALRQAQGPASYTFFAKTTDYASRFKLVFVANNEDGPSTGSGTEGPDQPFAFISNGNIILTADADDAILQIVDVMGRVLVCRDAPRASAIATAGMTPGVYVLRLINGDNVKTQKIIIK